jgi:hypothetical protein
MLRFLRRAVADQILGDLYPLKGVRSSPFLQPPPDRLHGPKEVGLDRTFFHSRHRDDLQEIHVFHEAQQKDGSLPLR